MTSERVSSVEQPKINPSSELQSVRTTRKGYKPLRSRKAPAIQAAILAKRAIGTSKRQIAKEMRISPNTVSSVIELSDFDSQLTSGRTLCAELIPSSVKVVKHRLAQNSETAAFRLLEGIGVLGKDAKPTAPPATIELTNAVNIMFQQKALANQQPIETPVSETKNESTPAAAPQSAESQPK